MKQIMSIAKKMLPSSNCNNDFYLWVGWVQPVFTGCGHGSRRRGKDKGSIASWENLLRKAIKLQEGWDTFLEPSHYFTHQG